jgi:hypothetical protein
MKNVIIAIRRVIKIRLEKAESCKNVRNAEMVTNLVKQEDTDVSEG